VALCRKQYSQDPFTGSLYVFRNRAGTAVKMICYDGVGFYLIYRRYSRGRLQWWPKSNDQLLQQLAAQQLAVLLAQGNPLNAAFPEDWRKIG
jgi:transposase